MKRTKVLQLNFFLIYRVLDAAARAKWLHNLIHKASVKKREQRLSDIRIGCLDIDI